MRQRRARRTPLRGGTLLLTAAALALGAATGKAQTPSRGASLADLTYMLRNDVSSARVLKHAQDGCIAFVPTAESEDVLRAAGGDATLVEGLRSVCRRGSSGDEEARRSADEERRRAAVAEDQQRRLQAAEAENRRLVAAEEERRREQSAEEERRRQAAAEERRSAEAARAAEEERRRREDALFSPMTAVYAMAMQGTSLGEYTTALTRESLDGRPVIRVRQTHRGGAMTQDVDLAVDARDYTPLYLRQSFAASGFSTTTDLRMENGRVIGRVTGLPQGVIERDAPVPAGTMLGGGETLEMMRADLENQRELTLRTYEPVSGTVKQDVLRVVGETSITVPAGRFDVYEVEVAGLQPMKFFLRKQAPHIVVRGELIGQPVSWELKSVR